MKRFFLLISIILLSSNCSSDDNRTGNPFIVNISFDTGSLINTSLPQYNDLNFPGNSIALGGFGVRGIMVANTGSGIVAFELTDPNHTPNNCSNQTLNGLICTCPCEQNKYNLLTGQQIEGEGGFPLVAYRVEVSGSIIRVFN